VIAVTRGVSPSIAQCELTHLEREPIEYERAVAQHAEYQHALEHAGFHIVEIDADASFPDCVFIEDTAVVLDEIAVIMRPGASSRRGEISAVEEVLRQYRELVRIDAPATLDGGDVLVLDDTIYVGLSTRTAGDAIDQLARATGRRVIGVPIEGCLHLKTAVTRVSDDALLINRQWVDSSLFDRWHLIDVDPEEPSGANALLAGESVIYPEEFPRTRDRLEARGLKILSVNASELAKAEGGVTCCSLILG
jgi:dimethylargininase